MPIASDTKVLQLTFIILLSQPGSKLSETADNNVWALWLSLAAISEAETVLDELECLMAEDLGSRKIISNNVLLEINLVIPYE